MKLHLWIEGRDRAFLELTEKEAENLRNFLSERLDTDNNLTMTHRTKFSKIPANRLKPEITQGLLDIGVMKQEL